MVGEISAATRIGVLGAIRGRYREASKMDKSRMLDEFVALSGCHTKHAVRLLGPAHLRRGGEAATDHGMGGFGQDMRQETEGCTAQHGGVAGEARASRPRP